MEIFEILCSTHRVYLLCDTTNHTRINERHGERCFPICNGTNIFKYLKVRFLISDSLILYLKSLIFKEKILNISYVNETRYTSKAVEIRYMKHMNKLFPHGLFNNTIKYWMFHFKIYSFHICVKSTPKLINF